MDQEQHERESEQAEDIELRPLECGVCMCAYDGVNRRPRTLPCGHTYCSVCLCSLVVDGSITCPSCRTQHSSTITNQFPINYALEGIMRTSRLEQHESVSQATGETCIHTAVTTKEDETTSVKTKWRGGKGLSKKMRSLIQEQRVSIETLQNTVHQELEQLMNYRTKLAESQTKHNEVLKKLKALIEHQESAIEGLVEEDMKVETLVGEGEAVVTELQTACDKLDKVIEVQNAILCIEEADHTAVEVEEWLQQIKEDIPNAPVLHSSFTTLANTQKLLDSITEETPPVQAISGHFDCTIIEAVRRIEGPTQLNELDDIYTKRVKDKLEHGLVFAVQENEDGTFNYSELKSEGNKLYMSALKKESPQRCSFTIEVDKLVPTSFPCIVFFDLMWPGTDPHRILIKLDPNTPAGQQFLLMCTGQKAHSYRNTNLNEVCDEGGVGERVYGGDYDGIGGTPLLPNLSSNQYRKGGEEGDVFWWGGRTTTCFVISIGKMKFSNVFGKVIEGFDVVRKAARYRPITEVKIVDCGVVCRG